jgi:hypothetical protein
MKLVLHRLVLYHGTSKQSALLLLRHGWKPNSWSSGGQQGQTKYLYVTTTKENAEWYANEKENGTVLKVVVPKQNLEVDPEDGVGKTVYEEINNKHGLPGNLIVTKPLPPSAFMRI